MNQFKSMCLLVLLVAVTASHATEYTVTKQVYFDVTIGDEDAGRIVIGLFGDIAPKTVANFIAIATDGIDGKTFAGTKFHRVISKFMIQGGDVDKGDGSGSISIYGKYFDDETFKVKHTGPGFISMANAGKNTNGCQFFITTIATPWLDGKHTAFGKVIKGQAIVHKIELTKTDADDHPLQPIVIKECGLLETTKPFQVSDDIYDYWAFLYASAVPLGMSFSILFVLHWMIRKINASEASIEKEINECIANKSKTE